MWYIILIGIIIAALLVILWLIRYTAKTLDTIDQMLDMATEGTFSESAFTEKKLSRIETKMSRYLSKGTTSLKQIKSEKDTIQSLIADISHQTKTPIANILLYSQLLSERQGLDEKAKNLACQIESQTEKLNFLISSLVKTSRLENGIVKLNPKKNSVQKLIENIDLWKAADKKDILLEIQNIDDYTAYFDFKWTLEAVLNIVDNAIKYTDHGGRVKVSAKDYEMFVCIDISDNGIGISEEESAKIFTRFYRSPQNSDQKGVGIGLYLAREIDSQENGYIRVKSSIGRGSTFSVFLPKHANISKL